MKLFNIDLDVILNILDKLLNFIIYNFLYKFYINSPVNLMNLRFYVEFEIL